MELQPGTIEAYLRLAFTRMVEIADRLGEPLVDQRPLGEHTNAVGALIVHCCGVAEFWLGHVALGVLMLARRLAGEAAPLCSEREVRLLQHLIASHHGTLEHGAAVRPMTLEAEALHYADDASAKTSSMAEALASPEHFAEQGPLSTRPIWQVDHRRVFRGRGEWGERDAPRDVAASRVAVDAHSAVER